MTTTNRTVALAAAAVLATAAAVSAGAAVTAPSGAGARTSADPPIVSGGGPGGPFKPNKWT